MAGGRETPRQKMIGMMYLVLTALLALNVSKEVIAAFVTINDKLNASSEIINRKSNDSYGGFDQKKAALVALKSDLTEFNVWHEKAIVVKDKSTELVGYILSECNEMIVQAEGEDWVESKNENGTITALKPLIKIKNMDNYDIPTNLFVGGDPQQPNQRGLAFREKIHTFRNEICRILGTYSDGGKTYSFSPPLDSNKLDEALLLANSEDRDKLKQFYLTLTIPERLESHDSDEGKMPWASVIFDHAPIVAAASILNALKLDIKNAESIASDYLLAKVDAPIFDFNKIEPMTFAKSGYINQGDSLNLNVMIAAYDTNTINKIRYGIDADTIPDHWKEVSGGISLMSHLPGQHRVKGEIGVQERGEIVWKPWAFNYTVGKPMGVIALPEMRVFYKGYPNIIEGTASGFPADRVTLSGRGCRLTRQGDKWKAVPDRGVRLATVSIIGTKEDGNRVNLGAYDFKVKDLPPPSLYLGGIKNGTKPGLSNVRAQRRASIRYDQSVNLTNVTFRILSGKINVVGIRASGKITSGGQLDRDAIRALAQSQNKDVIISVAYESSTGKRDNVTMQFFTR